MQIHTKRFRDRDNFHKDPNVNGVVDLLLTDQTNAFDEVINLVNGTYTYSEYKKQITIIKACLLDDPNALRMLNKYCNFLENIYKEDGRCGNLRGALLERLVYRIFEHKYGLIGSLTKSLNTNCYILIEDWQSNKTVDVFYYSDNKFMGESVECKVHPYDLENEHVEKDYCD